MISQSCGGGIVEGLLRDCELFTKEIELKLQFLTNRYSLNLTKTLFVGVIGLVLFVSSLSCQPGGGGQASGPSEIVCTTNMIGDMVNEIVDGKLKVTTLMGAGVDPHLFSVTEKDLSALTRAQVIFYNGHHLEGKMGEVLKKLSHTRNVVALAETLPIEKLYAPPEYEGNPDPHVWFDISLWIELIPQVVNTLKKVDPDNSDHYEKRGQELKSTYKELDVWVQTEIQKIPQEQRILITAHDAFGYFGKKYSIEVMALQGISTITQAGVKDIERIVKTIVERKIKAIFVETSVPKRTVEAVIESCRKEGHEVKIGGELYSDSMGAEGSPGGTYVGMMKHNVNALVSSLK